MDILEYWSVAHIVAIGSKLKENVRHAGQGTLSHDLYEGSHRKLVIFRGQVVTYFQ